MQIIWKNCGILLGKIVAFCLEKLWRFTCSLIYTRIYISCVYAVISILQRSLLARHAERCMWRSHVSCPQADVSCTYGAFHAAEPLFRLKVRGERLKAGSFYRFALNFGYVIARGRGVIKRQFMSI